VFWDGGNVTQGECDGMTISKFLNHPAIEATWFVVQDEHSYGEAGVSISSVEDGAWALVIIK